MPGPRDFRRVLARRPGNEQTHAERASAGADGEARVRLSELQSPGTDLGNPECRHAAGLFACGGTRDGESRRTGA